MDGTYFATVCFSGDFLFSFPTGPKIKAEFKGLKVLLLCKYDPGWELSGAYHLAANETEGNKGTQLVITSQVLKETPAADF